MSGALLRLLLANVFQLLMKLPDAFHLLFRTRSCLTLQRQRVLVVLELRALEGE